MRRRLFNIVPAVSLLVFVVTVAAWMRSRHTADNFDELCYLPPDLSMQPQGIGPTTTQQDVQITLWNGGLFLSRLREQQDGETEPAHPWQRTRSLLAALNATHTATIRDAQAVAQAQQSVRDAQDAERQNNFDKALILYTRAANLDPNNSAAVQGRDHTLVLLGRYPLPVSPDPPTDLSTMGLNPYALNLDPAYRRPDIGMWFSFGRMYTPPDDLITLSAPLWPIAAITAVFPLAWFYRVCRHRRFAKGCCAICGYNLTANTSGVCPECGAAIQRQP